MLWKLSVLNVLYIDIYTCNLHSKPLSADVCTYVEYTSEITKTVQGMPAVQILPVLPFIVSWWCLECSATHCFFKCCFHQRLLLPCVRCWSYRTNSKLKLKVNLRHLDLCQCTGTSRFRYFPIKQQLVGLWQWEIHLSCGHWILS